MILTKTCLDCVTLVVFEHMADCNVVKDGATYMLLVCVIHGDTVVQYTLYWSVIAIA